MFMVSCKDLQSRWSTKPSKVSQSFLNALDLITWRNLLPSSRCQLPSQKSLSATQEFSTSREGASAFTRLTPFDSWRTCAAPGHDCTPMSPPLRRASFATRHYLTRRSPVSVRWKTTILRNLIKNWMLASRSSKKFKKPSLSGATAFGAVQAGFCPLYKSLKCR